MICHLFPPHLLFFNHSAIGRATALASSTGTAFPICLYFLSKRPFLEVFRLPPSLNWNQSGNVCIRAISFTDSLRLFSSPSVKIHLFFSNFSIGAPPGWIGACLPLAWIVKLCSSQRFLRFRLINIVE